MHAVEVSDHIMIAHSFRGAVFGPAQALHGATFAVSAAFLAERLDENGIVVDIGRANDVLKAILAPINYRNLDDLPQFAGKNTTTEFLTRYVFDRLAEAVRGGGLGRPGREIVAIRVTIAEIADRARLVRGAAVVSRGIVFAVPGSLATPTGGYAYDRRMVAELRALGRAVEVLDVGEGFPQPQAAVRAAACERLQAVAPGRPIVVDGLALGALPDAAAALSGRPLIALVHHPLALESGLTAGQAARLRESERAALAYAQGVIVTSRATARLLAADYGVESGRIAVAPPGVDPAERSPGSGRATLALLAVGSLVPRKGYDVLIAALAGLVDLPWHLTIAGDETRSPATAAQIRAEIARLGLGDRVMLAGAVPAERLAGFYRGADIFVLASRFEGYGMAYAEAVARGVPVIGTDVSAIPEAVPPGTGLLVPPDDASALAGALRTLMSDPAARRRLSEAARAARLPCWRTSAEAVARAIEAAS